MAVVGVLNFAVLQGAPPNEDSTIPGTFVAKDRAHCSDAFFCLLECEELVFVLLTFQYLPVLFLLPGTVVWSRLLARVNTS